MNELRDFDWQHVMLQNDTNSSFDSFHAIIKELHNKHFPKTKIKIRYNNNKPWLSDDLKEEIKVKNKLYCLSKKIPCLRTEQNYKTFKYKLKHKMKSEEKIYYSELFERYKGNMKKSWNLIKSILYRGNKSKFQNKFVLSNGDIVTDKNIICEKFNNFFLLE